VSLPPYATKDLVSDRLPLIFNDGIQNRTYCIRDLAASTVFTALYIGAVEGSGRYLGPAHVYRMTDQQAAKASDAERDHYAANVLKKNGQVPGRRWYADNTREPIRDETLRDGLVAVGAVRQRLDLPTTSSLPRYYLTRDFAALFDSALSDGALEAAIKSFEATHLSKGALARVTIMRSGAAASTTAVRVTFPNGDTRNLAPGPSSIISKAVIEVFAPRFLENPAVLWLSESGNKVVMRDDSIATAIGLKIEADKNLPDLILADLRPGPQDPLLVFVEVVATDGAITPRRQEAIYKITDDAGFDRKHVAFLTAYQDRESAGFRKTVAQLAWRAFAWFVSEPEQIVILWEGGQSGSRLSSLLDV